MSRPPGPTTMRRFQAHSAPGNPLVLAADHPIVIEGRSYFRGWAGAYRRRPQALVTGHNQRKIGKRVVKGRWSGMPIYTLTLEERYTCPRTCLQWQSCYGNRMPWSVRLPAGETLEAQLEADLRGLQQKHPGGFVVRLHILGDFYSVAYVERWAEWLQQFPALRVFGYTARPASDPIGERLQQLIAAEWPRFAVRSSGGVLPGIPSAHVTNGAESAEGIVCPAQTGRTDCCGTCGLCWATRLPVIFLEH